eukprot:CAMPEP_0175051112 /NCGR_PEP_ID=MMETSP0052_2-20121109/7617_1 /TAXON_ID=51329 ORGANISM="Polytomella parva, Strain SAG 63-3" /NCGR_SAMPLE_ID=MMETSP0052_2 /ASSEMBLY_ACC=CAM_ASM_000194 /LENGTH=541 /DNA_ID=CAMNT_0016315357 /DNA_START=84 /DNA_END=1705 /DNA_ORIENTATION=-
MTVNMEIQDSLEEQEEANAVRIALKANSADCVQLLLDAMLEEKVTPGSYRAITEAIPDVAEQYPTMCEAFLTGLPLKPLGEMEIPASIASRGMIVTSSPSYTSYKEMWHNELNLDNPEVNKGPKILMEASMVQLPFAVASGKDSLLHTMVESAVPVQAFGSDTVKAIIDFKWNRFARIKIYSKFLLYFFFVLVYTVGAILFSRDTVSQTTTPKQLTSSVDGCVLLSFMVVLFFFGTYYMTIEVMQLLSLGLTSYFESFWNVIDVISYSIIIAITPCVIMRVGIGKGQVIAVLFALETIMLWTKVLFFALAIDGVGTFIFMTAEIIKGMRYFLLLLFTLFISFAVAFMILFRDEAPGSTLDGQWGDVGSAILSAVLIIFGNYDPSQALGSEYGVVATILLTFYCFALIVILLNMLITLMSDIYSQVKVNQNFVFLKGRAELIIEVESTNTSVGELTEGHPFLHILTTSNRNEKAEENEEDNRLEKVISRVMASLQDKYGNKIFYSSAGAGGGVGGIGGLDGTDGAGSYDDDNGGGGGGGGGG